VLDLGRYLAYYGSLFEHNHGVRSLVEALASISSDLPDLALVLIIDSIRVSQIPTYRLYAEHLALSEQVASTGMAARRDLPTCPANALISVQPRPTNRQAEAGFSTKLGGHRAAGKPVFVTKTGAIASYLVDGHNVFFTSPDDVAAFAERLRPILAHSEEAAAVGLRGREAALQYCHYRAHGQRLEAIIDQLCHVPS
jgi:glycosyltransferase involved in cell wall biosynthesis